MQLFVFVHNFHVGECASKVKPIRRHREFRTFPRCMCEMLAPLTFPFPFLDDVKGSHEINLRFADGDKDHLTVLVICLPPPECSVQACVITALATRFRENHTITEERLRTVDDQCQGGIMNMLFNRKCRGKLRQEWVLKRENSARRRVAGFGLVLPCVSSEKLATHYILGSG
jgi:hypothetical protein